MLNAPQLAKNDDFEVKHPRGYHGWFFSTHAIAVDRTGRTYHMVPDLTYGNPKQYTPVMLDVAKLDESFAKDTDMYVAPGGEQKRGARAGFEAWVDSPNHDPIKMPFVCLKQYSNNEVQFGNGRHRYSVLRDRGCQEIAVTVPNKEVAEFKRRFGAAEHIVEKRFNPDEPRDHTGRWTSGGDAGGGIVAYHGTAHKVPKFEASHVGEGQGAASYGWGLYFAQEPKVAESYQQSLAPDRKRLFIGNSRADDGGGVASLASDVVTRTGGDVDGAISHLRGLGTVETNESAQWLIDNRSKLSIKEVTGSGNLYQVQLRVNPSELLDWDKPLSEQSDKVKRAIMPIAEEIAGDTGRSVEELPADMFYECLAFHQQKESSIEEYNDAGNNEQRLASQALMKLGIPGLMYLDQGSRYKAGAFEAKFRDGHTPTEAEKEILLAAESSLYLTKGNIKATVEKLKEMSEAPSGSGPRSPHAYFQAAVMVRNGKIVPVDTRTRNFVIWDDRRVQITHENGKPLSREASLAKSAEWNEALHPRDEHHQKFVAKEPRTPNAFTPEDRAAKVARLKALKAQYEPLANKGGLTAAEAVKFRSLNQEANSLRFELMKPLELAAIPSEQERQSTLPAGVVLIARNDLFRHKDVYDPILDAAVGVSSNADTAVDTVMRGHGAVTPEQFYDAFHDTREAMRKHYGETVKLYRAVGQQKDKPTANWATTREYAKHFGGNIISRDVPIDNVLAVNVGIGGRYHEIIVGEPPSIDVHKNEVTLAKRNAEALTKGCVMAMLEPKDAADVQEFASEIPDSELYLGEQGADSYGPDYGRETDSHCTLLYGLKDVELSDVQKALAKYGPFKMVCGRLKIFAGTEKDKTYDVVCIPAYSGQARKMNRRLKALPYENEFDDWKGHITVAYVKAGEGQKYVGNDRFAGKSVKIENLCYSSPDGGKVSFPIGEVGGSQSSQIGKTFNPDEPRDAHGRWTAAEILAPLERAAKQYDKFEDFSHDYSLKNFHGFYWHLTNDPNFKIDPKRHPVDASSMGGDGGDGSPGLMVTTDLLGWDDTFEHTRKHVAVIDLSAMKPNVEYRDTTRGFGHEMYVFTPEKAKVMGVMPFATAKRLYRRLYDGENAVLPQSEESLRVIWNKAHNISKAFNPDEARDERGRWTDTAASNDAPLTVPTEPRKFDGWKPVIDKKPRVLFRSISAEEMADFEKTGKLLGKGNAFNEFDNRKGEVFFADKLSEMLIYQGSDVSRVAFNNVAARPEYQGFAKTEKHLAELSNRIHDELRVVNITRKVNRQVPLHLEDGQLFAGEIPVRGSGSARIRDLLSELNLGREHQENLGHKFRKDLRDEETRLTASPRTTYVLETKPIIGGRVYKGAFNQGADEIGFDAGQITRDMIHRIHRVEGEKLVDIGKTFDPAEPRDNIGRWTRAEGDAAIATKPDTRSVRDKYLAELFGSYDRVKALLGPDTHFENYGYDADRIPMNNALSSAIEKSGIASFLQAHPLQALTMGKDWKSLSETQLTTAGNISIRPESMEGVAGCHLRIKDPSTGRLSSEVYLAKYLNKFEFGTGRLNPFEDKSSVCAAKDGNQLIEIAATHELTHQIHMWATPKVCEMIHKAWEDYKYVMDGLSSGGVKPITKYAGVNESEWFAETHTAYVQWPDLLSAFDPHGFKVIKNIREAIGLKG